MDTTNKIRYKTIMQVKRFGLQVLGMLKRIRQMDARKIFRKSDRFLFFDERRLMCHYCLQYHCNDCII